MIYRPVGAAGIDEQLLRYITDCRQEHGISPKKVSYSQVSGGRPTRVRRFALHGNWKNETGLSRARAAFDRLPCNENQGPV